MLKISRKTDYALYVLGLLSEQKGSVSLRELAKFGNLPIGSFPRLWCAEITGLSILRKVSTVDITRETPARHSSYGGY